MRSQPRTFVIVGLGLLGGSLGRALKQIFPKAAVIGVSRSRSKIRLAKRKGFITQGTTKLSEAVKSCDCVFICTPVDTIPTFISQIDWFAKSGTVVTDVGSTKEKLIHWVEKKKFKNIYFVGSHPMAGSHLTGLQHAKGDLYRSSFTFVTTHREIHGPALRFVVKLWQKLCRRVVVIKAKEHDSIVAEISHLPHLISALLIDLVSRRAAPFASTGFRDTTRVAQGDPNLWVPIFAANRKNLIRLLNRFRSALREMKNDLRESNLTSLRRLLKKSAEKRKKIS